MIFRGFLIDFDSYIVGVAGFEPTTSTSQMWRDTGLRYTPMVVSIFSIKKCSLLTKTSVFGERKYRKNIFLSNFKIVIYLNKKQFFKANKTFISFSIS